MFKLSLVKIKVASVCYLVGGCDRAKVHYAWSNRQLCWAHVLRTFDFLAQSHRYKAHGKRLVQNAESLFRYSQNLEQKRSQSMNTFHLLRRSEWTSNYSSINWTRGWASHPWREARSRSSLNMKLSCGPSSSIQSWRFITMIRSARFEPQLLSESYHLGMTHGMVLIPLLSSYRWYKHLNVKSDLLKSGLFLYLRVKVRL